jgi:predicted SAM-dependent methyltransferase
MNHYVQFGAGLCGPEGWLNFDVSPTLRLQRLPFVGGLFKKIKPTFPKTVQYGDIVSGLPLGENVCKAIYCSHVLEHLTLDDFRTALANTFRYLEPGGRFRFVLPDLERLAKDYVATTSIDASMVFMKDSYLGHQSRARGLSGLLRSWLGNSSHQWMWDYKAMEAELEKTGFENVRRAQFGDSGDPMFEAVEEFGRWEACLGVDCFKPKL